MTGDPKREKAEWQGLLAHPGLLAVSLYLFLQAVLIVAGVVGGHYPPLFLLFAASFMTAGAGLLRLFRWAWAMALAAFVLLASYHLCIFSSRHEANILLQGLVNLVAFLYLVQPEVRVRLR